MHLHLTTLTLALALALALTLTMYWPYTTNAPGTHQKCTANALLNSMRISPWPIWTDWPHLPDVPEKGSTCRALIRRDHALTP